MRATLWPPKPNELFSAAGMSNGRALCTATSRRPSSGSSRLIVGGTTLSRIARIVAIDSSAPESASR